MLHGPSDALRLWQMKPWFENLGRWALSHPVEMGELALITGLITLYGFFRNDVWAFLSFCGARFKRATKRLPAPSSADLAFVPIQSRCSCVIGKDGNQLFTRIDTQWHVTNVPNSRTIVRLLTARLLKPRVDHPTAHCRVLFSGFENEIVPGETCQISIYFFVHLHLQQQGKRLEVRFAVTDQFAKQHLLPAIALHTVDMTPKK